MSEAQTSSGPTSDEIKWASSFLGFSIGNGAGPGAPANGGADAAPGAEAQQSGNGPANGAETSTPTAQAGYMSRFRDAKKPGGAKKDPPAPTNPELQGKLKTLNDAIAAVGKSGFKTGQMKADAQDYQKQAVKAEAETDDKKREAGIKAIGDRIDEAIEHLGALSKSMKDVMGAAKGNPNAAQQSKIYQKALEDYYGLTIKVEPGMESSTHFDKVFDMFGTVPKSNTKQDQLKKLTYMTKDTDGSDFSGGAYGDKEIEMGDFGDATGKEDDGVYAYELNGKPASANSFNVTTLHEIGHAVDTKNGIMKAPAQSGGGYGGWEVPGLNGVITAQLVELKKAGPFSDTVTDILLRAALRTALTDGKTDQPAGVKQDDWDKIRPFLDAHCLPIRDAAGPYASNSPVAIGDRVYTESQGTWYSYSLSARGSTRVNNYQFRSPPEWFAEVYAITWLKKAKPPGAVDANVAKYCWNG